MNAIKSQIKEIKTKYLELKRKETNKLITKKEKERLDEIKKQLLSLAGTKKLLETRLVESVDLIKQLKEQRKVDPEKQRENRRQKHEQIIEKILETHKKLLEPINSAEKSQLVDKRKALFQEIQKNSQNNHKYLKDVREVMTKGFKKLNSEYLEKKFANLISLTEEKNNLRSKILESSKDRLSRLKGLTIPRLLKELNKTPPDQIEEIEKLTSLITELKDKEPIDKELDKELKYEELLKNQIKEIMAKLKADQYIDKKNKKKFFNKYTNFVNSKEIEKKSKKIRDSILKSQENIIQKYKNTSLERTLEPEKNTDSVKINSIEELIKQSRAKGKNISKNLFKKYLNNSLSIVDNKNKAEFKKVYKKLYTSGIKNSPKTEKEFKELFNKFKKIEEKKVKKENRTTNELPTPELPKDTPPFFQRFKPKPEISPWAKKVKKNSSQVITKPTKSTKQIRQKTQTFPKDSGKVMSGVSYENKLKSTKPPVQSSYQEEDKSGYTRIPTRNESKIIKLIKKLPSQRIKIKDIKSGILSIKNKEIQKQLRSLLDQKLISITRK